MEKYCKACKRVFKDSDFKICPYCGQKLSEREGRQSIPRKLRHQVFQRDNYRCRECGATNKQTRLHVDHILPVAKGGTNDLSNLQTLCEECNRAKYTDEWVGGQSGSSSYKSKSRVANYKPKPIPYFNKKGMSALNRDRRNRELYVCPNCRKTYAKTAKKCPHCGLNLKNIKASKYFKKENAKEKLQNTKREEKLIKNGIIWKKCPRCRHKLNEVALKCPYCDYEFDDGKLTILEPVLYYLKKRFSS